MANFVVKDYWVVVSGDDYIKVIEGEMKAIQASMQAEAEWIPITDIFGSESFLRISSVMQMYHINEKILSAAKEHRDWSENVR